MIDEEQRREPVFKRKVIRPPSRKEVMLMGLNVIIIVFGAYLAIQGIISLLPSKSDIRPYPDLRVSLPKDNAGQQTKGALFFKDQLCISFVPLTKVVLDFDYEHQNPDPKKVRCQHSNAFKDDRLADMLSDVAKAKTTIDLDDKGRAIVIADGTLKDIDQDALRAFMQAVSLEFDYMLIDGK